MFYCPDGSRDVVKTILENISNCSNVIRVSQDTGFGLFMAVCMCACLLYLFVKANGLCVCVHR